MPSFFARQDPLSNARTTFSSWDTCMAKVYCKWPVIIGILIGSLIIISIVTCVARCICCGVECACCCFRCCTCCCNRGSRSSGHKRMPSNTASTYPAPYASQPLYGASPSQPNPYAQAPAIAPRPSTDTRPVNQQYRSNPMPVLSATPERPQFATFDSTRAVVNEDALPAMPTWKDGRNIHVEVEQEGVPEKRGDVELDRLNHNGYSQKHNDAFGDTVHPRMSPRSQHGPYAPQDEYRRASPGAMMSPVYAAEDTSRHEQVWDQPQQLSRQPPSPHYHNQAYNTYHEQYPNANYPHPEQPSYFDSSAPPPQYIDYSGPAPPPQHHQPQSQPNPRLPSPATSLSHTNHYPPAEPTLYELPSPSTSPAPAPTYPGQRAYNASPVSKVTATTYAAFQPGR